jgi:hypothetical protein
MSWHCTLELEAACLGQGSSDGGPSAPWKKSRTAEKCSSDANGTVCWTCSRSGTTSKPSTADPGVASWISSLQASRASRSQYQGDEKGRTTTETYGLTPFASLEKSSRLLSYLKTCLGCSQSSQIELAYVAGLIDGEGCIGIQKSQVTSGTYYNIAIDVGMANKAKRLLTSLAKKHGGKVTHRRKKTHKWDATSSWRIFGEDAARLLTAICPLLRLKRNQAIVALQLMELVLRAPRQPNGNARWSDGMREQAAKLKTEMHLLNRRGPPQTEWPGNAFAVLVEGEWVTRQLTLQGTQELFSATWPPAGMIVDGTAYPLPRSARLISETGCGLWASPCVGDATGGRTSKGKARQGETGLRKQVQMWPTPKGTPSEPDYARRGREKSGGDDLTTVVGGQLNPQFVEWLMGWPLEWTALQPLAMDRFQEWLEQHGSCLEDKNAGVLPVRPV